jgi:prolyl 4-hydroxylase
MGVGVALLSLVFFAIGDASKREKAAQQLLTVATHYHQQYSQEGKQTQLKQAREYYGKAIKLDPTNAANAHSNLGALLFTVTAIEESRHHFESALRLKNNQSAALHFNLALLLSEHQEAHDEAAMHCKQAIAQKKGYAKAHHLLGNIIQSVASKGPYDEHLVALAEEQFQIADALSQTNDALELAKEFYPASFPPAAPHAPQQSLLSYQLPHLSRIEGLLTREECQHIIAQAQARQGLLQPSGTTNDGSGSRSSRSGFIPTQKDAVLERVRARVLQQLDLPRLTELFHVEELQVVQYGKGGHYSFHHDSTTFLRRFLTVIIYLTDAPEGGGTVFPLVEHGGGKGDFGGASGTGTRGQGGGSSRSPPAASARGLVLEEECSSTGRGLLVQPVAGDAVVFRNYVQATGKLDPTAVHAACPVTKGEKWAVNLWVRLKDGVMKVALADGDGGGEEADGVNKQQGTQEEL